MKRSNALLFAGVTLLTMALTELAMGRHPICSCGHVRIWAGNPRSAENSQQLLDWYSLSHILHGLLLWGVLRLMPISGWVRLMSALTIEESWEMLENSPFIIARYRAQTISLGYMGDSVLNSLSDVVMAMIGYWLAGRMPWWATVALALSLELISLAAIRDGLTLNLLMLVKPLPAIRDWQAG